MIEWRQMGKERPSNRQAIQSLQPANRSALEARTEPKLHAIVQALARQTAREHYAQSCLEAEEGSDSES